MVIIVDKDLKKELRETEQEVMIDLKLGDYQLSSPKI